MQYGVDHEKEALYFYRKVSERKHEHIQIEEPGLLVDTEHLWLGASLDDVRRCECCEPRTLEIKCPYIGREIEPKSAFLLPGVGGVIDKNGKRELLKNHIHYFQVQIAMTASPSSSRLTKPEFLTISLSDTDQVHRRGINELTPVGTNTC
jgi:hypothetical protein